MNHSRTCKGPRKHIMNNIQSFEGWCSIKLGKGNKTKFWKDKWWMDMPLLETFSGLYRIASSKLSLVSRCWSISIND